MKLELVVQKRQESDDGVGDGGGKEIGDEGCVLAVTDLGRAVFKGKGFIRLSCMGIGSEVCYCCFVELP